MIMFTSLTFCDVIEHKKMSIAANTYEHICELQLNDVDPACLLNHVKFIFMFSADLY